jgi:hypothetical protein
MGYREVPLDLALEVVLELPAQRLLLAAQAGHQGEPVVDLLAQVPRHHRLGLADPVERPHDRGRDLVAHPLGVGRAVLAREADHLVQPAVALLEDGLVGAEPVQREDRGARVEVGHRVPLRRPVPGAPPVAAQDDRRDVGELRDHELGHRPAVEVGPVEAEEGQVARHQRADVVVADRARGRPARVEVLGQRAEVPAVRLLVDGLREVGVPDEVLQVEELAGEEDVEAALLFLHGRRGSTLSPGAARDNSIHPARRASRDELERVLRGPRQEGRRVPAHPGLVPRPEVGRERVGALAARHLEDPLGLVPGETTKRSLAPKDGDWTRGMFESPGSGSAGMLSQDEAQRGRKPGERVLDPRRVAPAPGGASPGLDALAERGGDVVRGGDQEVVPGGERGVEQVGGAGP